MRIRALLAHHTRHAVFASVFSYSCTLVEDGCGLAAETLSVYPYYPTPRASDVEFIRLRRHKSRGSANFAPNPPAQTARWGQASRRSFAKAAARARARARCSLVPAIQQAKARTKKSCSLQHSRWPGARGPSRASSRTAPFAISCGSRAFTSPAATCAQGGVSDERSRQRQLWSAHMVEERGPPVPVVDPGGGAMRRRVGCARAHQLAAAVHVGGSLSVLAPGHDGGGPRARGGQILFRYVFPNAAEG